MSWKRAGTNRSSTRWTRRTDRPYDRVHAGAGQEVRCAGKVTASLRHFQRFPSRTSLAVMNLDTLALVPEDDLAIRPEPKRGRQRHPDDILRDVLGEVAVEPR